MADMTTQPVGTPQLQPPPVPPSSSTTPGIGTDIVGIIDLIRAASGQDVNIGNNAKNIADPLNQYRGQAGDMLMKLLTDPGSFKMDPGEQFAEQQGLEAVARHGNSMFGTTRAGNTPIELEKYATGFAEQAFNTRVDQLYKIAAGDPAAAANQYVKGQQNRDQSIANVGALIDRLLSTATGGGSLISWAQKLLGGGSSGGGGTTGTPAGSPDLKPGGPSDTDTPVDGGFGDFAPGDNPVDFSGSFDGGDLGAIGDIFGGL